MRLVIRTGYWLALMILVFDAWFVSSSLQTIAGNHKLVQNTRDILAEVERTFSLLKDAETGQRGFLLTEDDDYLQPFRVARTELASCLERLRELSPDHPEHLADFEELRRHSIEKTAELDETITLARAKRADAARAVVLTGRGKAIMDQVREVVTKVVSQENLKLLERRAASRAAIQRTSLLFSLTTGAGFLLILVASYLNRREQVTREKGESAIRQSQAWLSTTLSSIGDALIATDNNGCVRFMNPIAQTLTGWTEQQASGRPMNEIFQIFNESTRQPVENPVEKVIRVGKIVGLANHTILIAKDGTETPIDDSAAPIWNESGEVAGVVMVFRDISERKHRDEEIANQKRLAEFSRDLGLVFSESTTVQELLDRAVVETVRFLDSAFTRIWMLDETGEFLQLKASAGIYTHLDGPHSRIRVGDYKIGLIAKERLAHLTNHVIGDPRVLNQEWARRERMVSFAGYPLIVEDRLLGVWALFARHPLSATAHIQMDAVARGIALGIERLRTSDALREKQAWLSTTLSSVGDALIATDELGRIRLMNPIAQKLTAWTEAEASGKPIDEIFRIVNEMTHDPVENPVDRVLREGVGVGLTNHTALISKDGIETPIENSAAPIRLDQGKLLGVVMVFRDVSLKRRQDGALWESLQRFQELADAMPQIVWTARPDGHLDYFNERWHEFSGIPRNVEGDAGWQPFVHPDDLSEVRSAWEESIRTGSLFEIEFRLLHRQTARYRWHLVRALAIRDESGRVSKWLGTCTDIEDQKQIEDALRAARDEAEEANKAKNQFLAVLSHELRTPLNPILLATTSMLEKDSPLEDLRPNLEMIRQYVNLQARLIDDLLDVMRIVRGKMPLHWDVADAHVLIRQAVDICRSDLLSKGHGVELDLAAMNSHINTDPARLQQVFWNLIKNAVKFTPTKGKITIRTKNFEEEGGKIARLVIEVHDTGIGIDPAVLPQLFDHFQQGETTITRKYGGLGLGLAISKGIVEGHGGSISANSAGKDQGTIFRVELKSLPTPRKQTDTSKDAADQSDLPCHPCRLLVVEDEQATRRLMGRLLERLGHEVTLADSLESAMNEVNANEFDLVISDIGLPDGSGLELMRRVKESRGPIPAIALTGYGMEEDIQRSRAAGFTAHMTKPIDFMKLEAMIRQILHNSGSKEKHGCE